MHQRRFEKKTIYGYTKLHLLDCFPKLHSYYGMKLHVPAQRRRGSLTFPVRAFVSTASQHDLSAAKEIFQNNVFSGFTLLADKAYVDAQWTDSLLQNGTRLLSPSKRKRGKAPALPGGDIRDTTIASCRQPIESFFNWRQKKTNIQFASKVRSSSGLLLHIFGRLAAAFLLLASSFSYS